MSAIRPQRVAAAIHRAAQKTLNQGLNDPRVRGVITVTSVRVSPDLKHATVRVSIYPQKHESLTMQGLTAATRHIRHQVSDALDMPRTPEFRFELDRGLKAQAAIMEALRAEEERRDAGAGWLAGDTGAGANPPLSSDRKEPA